MTVVRSASELDERHGAAARQLAAEHTSGYALSKALLISQTPVEVSVKVCRTWFQNYITFVDSAGHLELQFGERIRTLDTPPSSGQELAFWLVTEHSVSAPARVCQKFLSTSWSSADRIMTPQALETSAGDRLRLREYENDYGDKSWLS